MKKLFLSLITLSLFSVNQSYADVKIGITANGMMFNDAKGTEETYGVTSTKDAELAIGFGSIFLEKSIMDKFSIGLDYVPYALESETVNNTQDTSENNFSVDIENHATLYALVPFGEKGVYLKAGVSSADVVVNETIHSGSTYSDTEILGGHLSLGLEKGFSEYFIRGEAGYSEYETIESNSSSGNTRMKAAIGDGIHAKISIGKSF